MAVLALVLAGCARQPEPTPLQAGAINTGTYPNLNILPPVAAPQLSKQDQAAQRAELRAARASQSAAGGRGISAAEQERLRRLAQTHEQNTLNAITGQP